MVLAAVGTGIAPIRSAIESGLLLGKEVKLYYGARRAATIAYERLFEAWKTDFGVQVQPIYSQGTLKQRQGYVQVRRPGRPAHLMPLGAAVRWRPYPYCLLFGEPRPAPPYTHARTVRPYLTFETLNTRNTTTDAASAGCDSCGRFV